MKKIEAIIRTTQFESVRDALAEVGVQFFTLREVKGYGLQKGAKMMYRGANLGADFIPRLYMEIVVPSDIADQVVKTIESSAQTGQVGDGKIFVMNVEKAIRIRTGERDESAL